MSSRPPSSGKPSCLALMLPPLLPLAVLAYAEIAEWKGHKWNVHGDFIGILILFLASTFMAILIEILLLSGAWRRFLANPRARTPSNAMVAGVAVIFVLFCVLVVSVLRAM